MKKKSQSGMKVSRFKKIVEKLKPVKNLVYDKHSYYSHKVKISDAEMESIKAGLRDIDEGRFFTNEEANAKIFNKHIGLGSND